jgi:hypothetical protein
VIFLADIKFKDPYELLAFIAFFLVFAYTTANAKDFRRRSNPPLPDFRKKGKKGG